jgi:1,4-alpha-glucan branching enzyme
VARHLALVLHTHLPFVRHPEHARSLEERWLYEAILECYLPLLGVLDRLERDRVPTALTMSLTPPLLAMWNDPLLRERFEGHLSRLRKLADREEKRLWGNEQFAPVAHFYAERLTELADRWNAIGGDLAGAFRRHWDEGRIELLGCSATHAYLPGLLPTYSGLVAQLRLGLVAFERAMGRKPTGIWLPECAFHPAFDHELGKQGIRYVVVDTHGLTRARPRVTAAPHRAAVSPSGCVFFARDPDASQAVWSREAGYPGDPWYRDFYRDVGYDLAEEELDGEVGPFGVRISSGLKYHRITGPDAHKEPYQPGVAREHAWEHARDFLQKRTLTLAHAETLLQSTPICVAPYDAELFGHWWFEGPDFLEAVFRQLPDFPIQPVTLGQHLKDGGLVEPAMPEACTWGAGGYGDVWMGVETAWFWRHIHHATRQVEAAVRERPEQRGPQGDALDQAVIELLLLQSSDWPFIVKTNTTVQYAEARFRAHHHRLSHLLYLAGKSSWDDADGTFLDDVKTRDNFLAGLPSHQLRAPFLA